MKQEIASENKTSLPHSAALARVRASKIKDSPRPNSANGTSAGLRTRPRSAIPEANNTQKARGSAGPNKKKLGEELGAQKVQEAEEKKLVFKTGNRAVEQHARLKPRVDANCKRVEYDPEGKKKELQHRLDASENLVKDLQSEILSLKSQLETLQGLNMELEMQNKQFAEDLAAAEAKITALSSQDQMIKVAEDVGKPKFGDVQKLVANILEQQFRTKEVVKENKPVKIKSVALEPVTIVTEIQPKFPMNGPPPPPPPPPPRRAPAKTTSVQKAPALVKFYHSLTKCEGKKDSLRTGNFNSPVTTNAHSSIVGELQNRSSHLLAIKADIETKGDFIKSLIQKVQGAAYTDIDDVLSFVDWLDGQLSSLADERAVLKHFDWPEKKADAMREAAFEYRGLKLLHMEISSYEDDTSMPCEASLKKIATLLDKSERGIHRLIKMRNLTMPSYRSYKIPTEWMLDSGMINKIKLASVKLARLYMKRVSSELESFRHSENETMQESLLLQCVRFAYRAHQFAGGLDSETMCAFEEIRKRVPNRELLPGMTAVA